MATIDKATQTQLDNIEKSSGRKVSEWYDIINKSGFEKHGELVKFLKEKHHITHGNANVLVHFARQSHAGAAADSDSLITDQYKGKENLKPWYDKIINAVNEFGKDVEIAPKKTYVSLRRKKQFAIIQPSTKTRMDIGLNIKGTPPSGIVEAAGSWNAMCTHRVRLEDEKSINRELIEWIRRSYDQAG